MLLLLRLFTSGLKKTDWFGTAKLTTVLEFGKVIPAVAPHIRVLPRHKRFHAQKSGDQFVNVLFLFRPRMRLVVDRCQVLEIQVGVYLGGRNIGVAQQFLDRTQVAG